ncbi:EF-hand domain-containing protein D1 [Sigmodon hispidus]
MEFPDLESMFKNYDAGRYGFIDLMELNLMMEKLGATQNHLGLKRWMRTSMGTASELQEDNGLLALAKLSEINVALEGVRGAKNFFEAKAQVLSCSSRFEAELKAEQDERKREEEAGRILQAAFGSSRLLSAHSPADLTHDHSCASLMPRRR